MFANDRKPSLKVCIWTENSVALDCPIVKLVVSCAVCYMRVAIVLLAYTGI